MKNWSVTTLTTIAISVAVLLLLHIGHISLQQCFRRLEDTTLSQQRLTVLMIVASIKYDLAAAVAGEHAYVFSGKSRHLKQYKDGIRRVDQGIQDLDIVMHGRHRIVSDEVKSIIRVRRECAEEVMSLKDNEGTEAALAHASALGEDQVTKHIESMMDELATSADNEFKLRAREMDRGSMQTVAGITLLMSLALVILLVIAVVVNKYVSERQRAERRFRAVFNQTFQFSGLMSPNGSILEVNQSALDFAGIDAEEVINKPFWETPWWSHSKETQERIQDAIKSAAGGEMVRLEEEVSGKDGSATVDFSVKPVLQEDGEVLFLISEARDITERKIAEREIAERETRLRAIVETAPDGIVTVNSDGTIESVNSALERLFGYEDADLVGKDVNIILPSLLTGGDAVAGTNPIRTGERRVFGVGREFHGVKSDGSLLPVEVALSAMRLKEGQVLTGIVRDITERKEAERRVKEFYSTVSHELRTPLTAIRTALGLIEASFLDQMSEKAKPVLDIASEEADRLIRLINDILDIRKIEAGKIDLEIRKLSCEAVIARAVSSIEGLAEDAKVTIDTNVGEIDDNLLADEDRIQQVLSNLLSNAIKWSPVGGQVTIRAMQKRGKCRFEIEDEGPGVPEDQLEKLFGKFEQVKSRDNREKGGTGLGLAIAKSIVEQHGGSIGVESREEEEGTMFWFEIPLATEEGSKPELSVSA